MHGEDVVAACEGTRSITTPGEPSSSDTVFGSTRLTMCTWPDCSADMRAVVSFITRISIESTKPTSSRQWFSYLVDEMAHARLVLLDLVGAGADAGVRVVDAAVRLDDEVIVG